MDKAAGGRHNAASVACLLLAVSATLAMAFSTAVPAALNLRRYAGLALTAGLALALLRRALGRGSTGWPRLSVVDGAVTLYFGAQVAQLLTSTYRPNTWIYLTVAIACACNYFLIRLELPDDGARRLLVACFSGIGCLYAVLYLTVFLSYYGQWSALGLSDLTAFRSQFEPPRENITLMLALLPAAFITEPFRFKAFSASWFLRLMPPVFIVLALLMTFSRGAYLGLFAFSAVASLLQIRSRGTGLRRLAYWHVSVAAPVLLLLLSTSCFRYCLTTAAAVRTSSQIRSVSGHAEAWKFSTQTIRQHPLFGVGAYNSPLAWMQFRARSSRPFSPIAFNWALQSWQDSGAVGLCALVFLLGASLWQACAHARRSGKGDFAPQVSILWAAGLVAVLIRDMSYSSITLDPGVMLVLWTGLAATAGAATAERNQQEVACSVPQELATVG